MTRTSTGQPTLIHFSCPDPIRIACQWSSFNSTLTRTLQISWGVLFVLGSSQLPTLQHMLLLYTESTFPPPWTPPPVWSFLLQVFPKASHVMACKLLLLVKFSQPPLNRKIIFSFNEELEGFLVFIIFTEWLFPFMCLCYHIYAEEFLIDISSLELS